jgi:hypothetical protein
MCTNDIINFRHPSLLPRKMEQDYAEHLKILKTHRFKPLKEVKISDSGII